MKLSEYIVDVGRPISYYPNLKKVTKSTTATIFLCQFIYWIGKGETDDGSIYKTSAEIEEETGLTYEEQKNARLKLKLLNILEEKYARLDHTIYFKFDLERLDELWALCQTPDGHHGKASMGNKGKPHSLNSNTEITSDTTTGKEPERRETAPLLSHNIPEPITEPCDMDGVPDSWKDIKPKTFISEDVARISRTIGDLLGIKPPIPSTKREYAAANVLWWTPIKEMLRQVDGDVVRAEQLLEKAMGKLRETNFVISTPQALLKTYLGCMVRNVERKRDSSGEFADFVVH